MVNNKFFVVCEYDPFMHAAVMSTLYLLFTVVWLDGEIVSRIALHIRCGKPPLLNIGKSSLLLFKLTSILSRTFLFSAYSHSSLQLYAIHNDHVSVCYIRHRKSMIQELISNTADASKTLNCIS